MEVCNKRDDEDVKIDTAEQNITDLENLAEARDIVDEEEIDCVDETIKPVSPKVNLPPELQGPDKKSIGNSRIKMKKKKKKKKSKIVADSLQKDTDLALREDCSEERRNFKSDALHNGDDLCIRDFEVEISSFNLSKPVLLNLDTYRIEPSITAIENVVSMEPALQEPTENLEVSLDPNMFFPELIEDIQIIDLIEASSESDAPPPKEVAEVSLLTSSDEDDVILQEPYIETIEVSDACSDDEPLAKLLNLQVPTVNGKRLKRKLKKYTCNICSFWSYSRPQYTKHVSVHDWYFCTKCDFACSTERKLSRHYKTHIFNFLCERKSRRCKTDDGDVDSGRTEKASSRNKKYNKRRKKCRAEDNTCMPSVEI
ncbi:hypothetical protein EVAR_77470_1 [Eumeta japonica]|uniref:C2H2-type domain-containing protein n=1 Tax=Eumeta variegata TaxID=151549 RepID=A0A4C1T9P5_EUMVA|nr:hypothetical protein EVAR_77470_1 [Eumeta japonica]